MRIGMILDKHFPPDPRVENEAITLINQGHEVFLFSLNYANESRREAIHNIRVFRYKASKILYKLSALAYSLPFYNILMKPKIAAFIKEHSIESLHIHDMQVAKAVFDANKNFELPVVLDLHENRPEIMRFYPHVQRFPGRLLISIDKWKKKESAFIKRADSIIVVTEEAKSEILSRALNVNKNKIVVVPNTVHKKYAKNASIDKTIIDKYEKDFVLLYIGDTGLRRGLLTAIDSLIELKKYIPTIKLLIVGSSSYDTQLKKRVNDLNLQASVIFEGWQNASFFPSYIKASSICISPLHENLHHNTTYANKLFQYMSLGRALLVSDVLAQKNIVIKAGAGEVHEAENSVDFANKVMTFFKDPVLMDKCAAYGQHFLENEFFWEKTSQNLIDLYTELSK